MKNNNEKNKSLNIKSFSRQQQKRTTLRDSIWTLFNARIQRWSFSFSLVFVAVSIVFHFFLSHSNNVSVNQMWIVRYIGQLSVGGGGDGSTAERQGLGGVLNLMMSRKCLQKNIISMRSICNWWLILILKLNILRKKIKKQKFKKMSVNKKHRIWVLEKYLKK